MSETISTWPDKLQARTQAEWDDLVKNWANTANRQVVLDGLKLLKIPAMVYARINDPKERTALIIAEQKRLLGDASLTGGEAPKTTEKKAAPKATGGASAGQSGGSAGGAAASAAIIARFDALEGKIDTLTQILKVLLMQNPDALSLCADQDTLNELGSKSLPELAGNG